MHLAEFHLQPRGPYQFDTWLWCKSAKTSIGLLPLELYTDVGGTPSQDMMEIANSLVQFSESSEHLIREIIFGHYCQAKDRGWLSHWEVPDSLNIHDVLNHVDSITLNVHQDSYASVHVDPRWDPEHKLSLTFEGSITEVNDEPFELRGGILCRV